MPGFIMLGIIGDRYFFAGHALDVIDRHQVTVQVFLGGLRRIRHDPGDCPLVLATPANDYLPEGVWRCYAM